MLLVIRFAASSLKNHTAQSPKKRCLQPHYVLEATEFASSCTFSRVNPKNAVEILFLVNLFALQTGICGGIVDDTFSS